MSDPKAMQVLIVHSTIAFYRLPFFNALERLRPKEWEFRVTFDPTEFTNPRFMHKPLDPSDFAFQTADVKHCRLPGGFAYQTAFRHAGGADLVIANHAVRDLAHMACMLHRLHGVKYLFWGHGRDRSYAEYRGAKRLAESVKIRAARLANGYLAYTEGVRNELIARGLRPDRVFALQNTVDIESHRRAYEAVADGREALREEYGIGRDGALLWIGRFTENKRVGFLLDAFSTLRRRLPNARLLMVGPGGEKYGLEDRPGVKWFGPLQRAEDMAPIYAATDVFAFPGSAGLGPMTAVCYDLPVVFIDSPVHMPEVEYLTPQNSVMLEVSATPDDYALVLGDLLEDRERLGALRDGAWASIKHLTIDNMAKNFIAGVNTVLAV